MLLKIYAILLVTVAGITFLPTLNATLIEADVNIEGIKVNYTLMLSQNFTTLKNDVIKVDQSNLGNIAQTIEESLRKLSPEVKITNLEMEIIVTDNIFTLIFSFRINGVIEKTGNLNLVDCTWKSFSIENDLMIDGVHINRFGEAYIKPTIASYSNSSNLKIWVEGTQSVFPSDGVNIAGNATLLNFVDYKTPLDAWNKTFFLENKTTRWQYTPDAVINMTATYNAENISLRYYAVLEHNMRIYAPGLANAEKDVIIINQGQKSYELTFALIIMVAFILSIAFYIMERKSRKTILKKNR